MYLVRNIVNDYNTMSSSIVARCDSSKTLLACRVPLEKQKQWLSTQIYCNIVIYTRTKCIVIQRRNGDFDVSLLSI